MTSATSLDRQVQCDRSCECSNVLSTEQKNTLDVNKSPRPVVSDYQLPYQLSSCELWTVRIEHTKPVFADCAPSKCT